MKRTVTQLADGRELIYFDERDDAVPERDRPAGAAAAGRRRPSCATTRSLDEWVAIAAHRQTRTFLPPADECPLCPSAPDAADARSRRPTTTWWCSRTASPRSATGVGPDERRAARAELRSGRARAAARWCASPPTTTRPSRRCPTAQVGTVMEAWADRTAELSALARRRAGLLLREPRAPRSASRCSHPHGQIYAYPFVTPRTRRMLAVGRRRRRTGRQPVRRRAGRRAGRRVAGGGRRTSTGRRSCPRPRAGRSRCTCTRTGRCPTSPALARRRARRVRAALPRRAAPPRRHVRRCRCRTSRPGTRRRSGSDRDLAYLHLQLFSIRRAPGQAEVPRRVGVGHGRVRQRRTPRGGRAHASITGRSLIDFRLESRVLGIYH